MKSITVTLIFEGSALNRDEKVDQNTLSVKRLTRPTGEHTFISKPAIRHYLFETLTRMGWKEARVIADNKVVQFDLLHDDILTSEELDVFGYMFTPAKSDGEKGGALVRKAPLGITKAISLEPYLGDLAFYANHHMVHRARREGMATNPDPYGKEEHMSFYKVSFTLDSARLGTDEWLVPEEPEIDGNEVKIKLHESKKEAYVKVVKGIQEVDPQTRRARTDRGEIRWEPVGKGTWSVTFHLNPEEKQRRIRDLLEALRNGLVSQCSGEANTLTPVFFLAAPVRVPSPIFHPKIDLILDRQSFRIRGIQDALANGWREDPVYLYVSDRLEAEVFQEDGMYVDRGSREHWESWVKAVQNTNLSS